MKLSEQIKAKAAARSVRMAARYKYLRATGLTSAEARIVMHWSDEKIRTDPELLERFGEIEMLTEHEHRGVRLSWITE